MGSIIISYDNTNILYKKIRYRPQIWYIYLRLLLTLSVSVIVSIDKKLSTATLVSIAFLLVASNLLIVHLASVERQKQFFDVVANVGRIVIVSSGLLWVMGVNLGRGGSRFSGWTDNPNTLGLELAPTLIIMIAGIIQRKRGSYVWNVPFIIAGIFLLLQTDSRASILWVAVSTMTLAVIRVGIIPGALLAIFAFCIWGGWGDEIRSALLALVNRHPDPFAAKDLLSGRSEVWQLAYDLIPQRPLLGFGIGTSYLDRQLPMDFYRS
ncbi:hypothetical protein KKP04_10570 [Rhodomicrobium sp. Az07]|uniref:O-antigen ligase family protein n=1 Tax=Rhodomicrobium sp. Az07 TaxID=2839034 RepID=UPI001BED3402|nr:O-antigen ligase family protein [Rhodomicrobium sp. Az07]MBT3071310.1 hypothetical protein [Rhodomicrobium sp. Az07]